MMSKCFAHFLGCHDTSSGNTTFCGNRTSAQKQREPQQPLSTASGEIEPVPTLSGDPSHHMSGVLSIGNGNVEQGMHRTRKANASLLPAF